MNKKHIQSLKFKYPPNREVRWKYGFAWLVGKKHDDGAEGLWRVHDGLYDLTTFVKTHPGGSMWLELTKGTDITEAFETHHLTSKPTETLQNYYNRKAKCPRNSPFTFEDDGFYRTLKRNIIEALKGIPPDSSKKTKYLTDVFLVTTFIFSMFANYFWSYIFAIASGVLLASTAIAAHNYLHQKDNFRMYYFNLSMLQFREWRISHCLSHHLFPNTIIDYQISFFEPFIEYLPSKKSLLVKYGSGFYIGALCLIVFIVSYLQRIAQYFYFNDSRHLHWSDLIPFILPIAMHSVSIHSISATFGMWLVIIMIASFWFGMVGFNTAHHHPEIFHEGDAPRSDYVDWGIYQLDTLSERAGIMDNLALVLITFGDHALHHLFPTLDHGVLTRLYPVLDKTMKKFNLDLRFRSHLEMVRGHFQQLAREEANCNPPGQQK